MIEVLKFYADWCGPCRVLKTMLASFDACSIRDINVDDDPVGEAPNYGVRALPTLIVLKDNQEVWRKSGVVSKAELDSVVNKLK